MGNDRFFNIFSFGSFIVSPAGFANADHNDWSSHYSECVYSEAANISKINLKRLREKSYQKNNQNFEAVMKLGASLNIGGKAN
jgi:hypothetical protein